MTADSPQVQALRQRYQQSLAEKSNALRDYLTTLTDADVQSSRERSQAHIDEVREYLHKLAGSAGMYGYADVAQISRSAMEDCQPGNLEGLFSKLNELRNLLDQHS